MKEPDYARIRELLTARCVNAITEFAATADNREVYLFCVWCDPDNGSYGVAINTREGFRKRIAEAYGGRPEEGEGGIGAPKYNFGDCAYIEPGTGSRELDEICEQWLAYAGHLYDTLPGEIAEPRIRERGERFVDQAVEAIRCLADTLSQLDCTEDFIAYVELHERSDEENVAVLRRTVSEEQIARALPDIIKTERLHAQLRQRPEEEQAQYWRDAWFDFLLERGSPLEALGLCRYSAEEELVKLGAIAEPHILDIAEYCFEHAVSPGVDFLQSLGVRAHPDGNVHDRLRRLLRRALELPHLRGTVYSVLLAGLLHQLFPAQYPEPPLQEEATNRLWNPEAFGIEPLRG